MAGNKEIRIKWLSDESDIDKSIQSLQRKLQNMNKSNTNINEIRDTGGTLSKRAEYAQKAFQQTAASQLQKESREIEQKQRLETQALMQKQRELREIEKTEGQITEEKKKQMDLLKQEISMKAQQVMDLESSKNKIDKTVAEIRGGGPNNPAGGGSGQGGPPDQNKAMKMFTDMLKSLGVASVLNGAVNFAQHRIERDRKVLADQGQTAQMASREMREQLQGQGMRGLFFSGQRKEAMDMAAQEQSRMGKLDFAKLGAGIAGGAAAGSFIPGLGNVAGAVVGGIGAFGGMMAGSDKMYSRVFDQDQYKQMMTREGMQKYEANRRMLEMKDPMKSIAFDSVNKNIDKDVQLERSLGLGNRDLYGQAGEGPMTPKAISDIIDQPIKKQRYKWGKVGRGAGNIPDGMGYDPTGTSPLEGGMEGQDFGAAFGVPKDFDFATAGTGDGSTPSFLKNAMDPYKTGQNFGREDVEASVQSLIGAGATTEGARGMAGQALQFQRNLRLQNAPGIMGQMSGAGMETAQTDDATIRLMAEAVKLGVDTSKMPQEMQRMTAITASLATSGGGFSQMAAENFGAGLTGFSQSELGGAKSAFEEMQGRAKEGGGFEGQMGMGFLMGKGAQGAFGKDAAGKLKKNSKLMNALNQYSAEDLQKDPALAKGLAQQLGIEPSKLIEGMRKKDEYKQTRMSSQQDAAQALGDKMKGMTPEQVSQFLESEEGSELYGKAAIEDVAAFGSKESGKGAAERKAGIVARARRLSGGMPEGTGTEEGDLQSRLSGPTSELEQIRSAGKTGDALQVDAVSKELDNLVASAKKHSAAAEMYNIQFEKFVDFAKKSGDALEQMSGQIDKVVEMMTEAGIPPSGQPNN